MIKRLNYYYNSEYYILGSMLYYLIFKKIPNDIIKNLIDIQISYNKTINFSASCIDFINKLMNHSFLNNFNWNDLVKRNIKSPFPYIQLNSSLNNKTINFAKKIFIINECLNNKTLSKILFSYNRIIIMYLIIS